MERANSTINYYDEDIDNVDAKLNHKLDDFLPRMNKNDIVFKLAQQGKSTQRRVEYFQNPKLYPEEKTTPLQLLGSTTDNVSTKIMERYLPDLKDKSSRHPPSAFDVITPFDSKAKEKLDEWLLQLLDGPELYHILGLIELPIEIRGPGEIHHLEDSLAFELFSESNGKYTSLPGFISSSRSFRTFEKMFLSYICIPNTPSQISARADIKPDQYRPTIEDRNHDYLDPTTLRHEVPLLISPIDNTCCFSYAHSDVEYFPIRSVVGIPAFNGKFGIWKHTSEELKWESTTLQIDLEREEIELILICDAVRCFYKKIREEYIGPNKPGAFQLLKDWMSYNLPEGREQALYLTNYAIVRSLLYADTLWPDYCRTSLSLPKIYIPNTRHTNWDHLVGYFQQLVRKYTLEEIPDIYKSRVYFHFTVIMSKEMERILQLELDTNEHLHNLHKTQSLSQSLAVVGLVLHNAKLGKLFSSFFSGILLGTIPEVYIQSWNLLMKTIEPFNDENDDQPTINFNIKKSVLNNNFSLSTDREGLKDKSDIVDGLMKVLYDITIGCRTHQYKSKFFDRLTEKNSINVLPIFLAKPH